MPGSGANRQFPMLLRSKPLSVIDVFSGEFVPSPGKELWVFDIHDLRLAVREMWKPQLAVRSSFYGTLHDVLLLMEYESLQSRGETLVELGLVGRYDKGFFGTFGVLAGMSGDRPVAGVVVPEIYTNFRLGDGKILVRVERKREAEE